MFNNQPKVLKLNQVEVRYFWQLAFYASHGYRVKVVPRGNRVFMVRHV